ncbi:MAG TPA: hypothetical protein VGN60_00180 [Devosia sp.]|jgi:hypothetical protein|nr:hypothetical protein [Devosia sp.]
MGQNITAIYRTYAVADLVRAELVEAGVSENDIHIIPDRANITESDYQSFDDELHDLHLPEEDVRTYQHCVRQGDYVVSVDADHDDARDLVRLQQIMRRPEAEAHDLNRLDNDYAGEPLYPHSDSTRAAPAPELAARRDTTSSDPYLRSYRRGVV